MIKNNHKMKKNDKQQKTINANVRTTLLAILCMASRSNA